MNVFLLLIVLVVAAVVLWQRGSRGYALVAALLAAFPLFTLLNRLPSWGYLIAALLAAAAGWHHLSRSAALVTRWSGQSRRKSGVASTLDIARHASGRAMRRRAATVRPSLAALGRWARWRLPVVEVAIELCRSGWISVWSPIEDVVMIFGGPRTGKTGWLAGRIIDAPGAVLVTSTRTDLYELCAPLRARKGPVYVFNAVGLAGLPSTITFDPLTGCTDPVTASERAADMVAAVTRAGGGGDREFWNTQARRLLAALLHAAALGGRPMIDVQAWMGDADKANRELPALLRKSGVQAFEQDAMQFLGTNTNTRTSITSTVMPALEWLKHPDAEKAAAPGRGFDVEQLLAERATVFLLGAEETQAGPLVCSLTGHIARQARALATAASKGRLDPNLTLALDEAALISPVPLENWTADMGGRGVTIIAAFQSRAQLLARWGEHNTATILNNCGAVMVCGGTRDRDDLQFWSTLAGDRDERITTTDLHGRVASKTTRRVPVLPPAQIANLPTGRVLLIRRGIDPVIGRVTMAWRRRDVRYHQFAVANPQAAARLARWDATRRRYWAWATRSAQTVATATRPWTDHVAGRAGAVVQRWTRTTAGFLSRTGRLVIAWVRPPRARRRVQVDLDPPTVEVLLPGMAEPPADTNAPVASHHSQAPHSHAAWRSDPAERFGDGWWQ